MSSPKKKGRIKLIHPVTIHSSDFLNNSSNTTPDIQRTLGPVGLEPTTNRL